MNRLQMALLVAIKFYGAATFDEIFTAAERKMSAKLVVPNIQNALNTLEKRHYLSKKEVTVGILNRRQVFKYKLEARGEMQCRGVKG